MGYNAQSKLMFGVLLTKEEDERLSAFEDEDGDLWLPNTDSVGLAHSGDGRSEIYKPIFGLQLAKGYDWEPEPFELFEVTDEEVKLVKAAMKKHKLKYRKPRYYLVSYTG